VHISQYPGPVAISGFSIKNTAGPGVHIELSSDYVTIDNCTIFESAQGVLVELGSGAQALTIANSQINSNVASGVSVLNQAKVVLSNVAISGNGGDGVYAEYQSEVILADVSIQNNSGHGLNLLNMATVQSSGSNLISYNGLDGMHFFELATGIVDGCEVNNNAGDGIAAEKMVNTQQGTSAIPLEVKNCNIHDNSGWGVRLGYDVEINANVSGGVAVERLSRATVSNNSLTGLNGSDIGILYNRKADGRVESNTVQGFGDHGVVVKMSNPDPFNDPDPTYTAFPVDVFKNSIFSNGVGGVAVGYAMDDGSGSAVLANNIIAQNLGYGVMVAFMSSDQPIINNTIANNGSYGIFSQGTASGISTNNIIAFNGDYGIRTQYGGRDTINNDLIYGNANGAYNSNFGGNITNNGYLVYHPWLDSAFHLQAGSPCINAGIITAEIPADDVDNELRLDRMPDIGADEVCTLLADFNSDGIVDVSDLAIFAPDFGRTDCSGDCEGDFDGDNDVDGSDHSLFLSYFGRTNCSP